MPAAGPQQNRKAAAISDGFFRIADDPVAAFGPRRKRLPIQPGGKRDPGISLNIGRLLGAKPNRVSSAASSNRTPGLIAMLINPNNPAESKSEEMCRPQAQQIRAEFC